MAESTSQQQADDRVRPGARPAHSDWIDAAVHFSHQPLGQRGGVLELTARIDMQPGRQMMRTELSQMAEGVPPVMSLRHCKERRDRAVSGLRVDRELDSIADRARESPARMKRQVIAPERWSIESRRWHVQICCGTPGSARLRIATIP